jgi:Ser/Thr protein kinase RdoA (MazF antagonist)
LADDKIEFAQSLIHQVLNSYSHVLNIAEASIKAISNHQGYSGAQILQIETSNGQYCLRKHPQQTDRSQLTFCHWLLKAIAPNIEVAIAAPIYTTSDCSWLELHGGLWQLEPWLTGAPVAPKRFETVHLNDAITFLANFHVHSLQAVANHTAIASTTETQLLIPISNTGSKTISDRISFFAALLGGNLEKIEQILMGKSISEFRTIGLELCRKFKLMGRQIHQQLCDLELSLLPQIPVIRDCHCEHFLYSNTGMLKGYIDFGALRFDTVAADLGRLFADTIGPDTAKCKQFIAKYRELRPISSPEETAAIILAKATIVGAGMVWFDWILLRNWKFDLDQIVENRLRHWDQQTNRLVEFTEKTDDI